MNDALRAVARIARAEAWRLLLVQSRHRLEFIGSAVTLYAAFAALHLASRHVALPGIDASRNLIGQATLYAAWMWTYAVVGGLQAQAAGDVASGALEPLYATGVPLRWMALGRAGGFALHGAVMAAGLVLLALPFDIGGALQVAWGAVLFGLALAVATSIGIGLAFVGLVLVFRRVGSLMMPVSVLLMAVMLAPLSSLPHLLDALPWVASKRLMAEGLAGRVDVVAAAWAGLSAMFAVLGGLAVHGGLVRVARRRGRLGPG